MARFLIRYWTSRTECVFLSSCDSGHNEPTNQRESHVHESSSFPPPWPRAHHDRRRRHCPGLHPGRVRQRDVEHVLLRVRGHGTGRGRRLWLCAHQGAAGPGRGARVPAQGRPGQLQPLRHARAGEPMGKVEGEACGAVQGGDPVAAADQRLRQEHPRRPGQDVEGLRRGGHRRRPRSAGTDRCPRQPSGVRADRREEARPDHRLPARSGALRGADQQGRRSRHPGGHGRGPRFPRSTRSVSTRTLLWPAPISQPRHCRRSAGRAASSRSTGSRGSPATTTPSAASSPP